MKSATVVALFLIVLAALPAWGECVERRDMAVYFAIDMSSSMDGGNLDVAREFAVQLLDALGATGVVDEAASLQFCEEIIAENGWMSANQLQDNLSGLSITCSHPDLDHLDGTSLYDAIILTADRLRNRDAPVKLHVVITDGDDTTSANTAADATDALAPGGIIGRLIFVGGGSSTLQSIASNAGSHIKYREANSGNIAEIVDEILAATCANFRPHAAFWISDDHKELGREGFNIRFDPIDSTDDDGTIEEYAWRFTRPDGSTFDMTQELITPTFDDSQLTVGTQWSVRLTVTDDDGATDDETKIFQVIGSPPDISIVQGSEIEVDVLDPIELEATPTDDVDGGTLSFQWTVDSRPAGSTSTPTLSGATFSLDTVGDDIGTWVIGVMATDNEGQQDGEEITVHVRNLPPEIDLVGLKEIDIGDTIEVETTILDDADGGVLSFEWDIIQSPDPSGIPPQEGFHEGVGTGGATLSIPTSAEHAGTWIVRLTATDDDNQPNSSVSEEFTVLVDAPVEAVVSGPGVIGSLSFPLVLSSEDSTDPDTDAPHSTLDGRPEELSRGIAGRVWRVIDVPFDLWDAYPLGRVDEVFGIAAGDEEMELDFGDVDTGQWKFQVDVHDAEENEHTAAMTVTVADENTNPTAITNGIRRYLVEAGTNVVSEAVVVDGSASADFDDILPGGTDGIDNHAWTVELAPPTCPAPSIAGGAVATLFPAGAAVPLECHGLWRVGLTVTDRDSPAKTGSATAELVIGNCPEPLCIDAPTASMPELVEFSDGVEVEIIYHIDSAIYSDPLFFAGMFAQLDIFHESDLSTPFYTNYDFNLLPTDERGTLVFKWNGYSNEHQRPPAGMYAVRITLLDQLQAFTPFDALEPDAIWIAVVEPQVLASSDRYENVDRLEDGSETLRVDWELTGAAVPDQMVWRLRDDSAVLLETPVAPAMNGAIVWNGRIGAAPAAPGEYTIEIEAFRLGVSLGMSELHPIVLYRLTTQPLSRVHPNDADAHLLFVNNDDDDGSSAPDRAETPVAGEDDLGERELVIEPLGVDLRVVLRASSNGTNVQLWDGSDKSTLLALDQTFDLASDTPPSSVFIEGVASGETILQWALQEPDGTPIEEVPISVFIADVNLHIDTNMNGTINYADDLIEMNDQAIIVNVNNDADGGGIDSLDAVINGVADTPDLTTLTLRRNRYLPAGWRMVLRVSNHAKIRIFDDTDTAVIGPPPVDGGPNVQQFDVPANKITAGDLTYRIETVHPDLSTISLILFDGATEVARDEVKAALNVDREPGPDSAHNLIRNRVNLLQFIADVRGIEAHLMGNRPIVSWAPAQRKITTTSYWVSIQDASANAWLQTGIRTIRQTNGTQSEELYFEFVPIAGGYQAFAKFGEGWRDGTFRVEKTGAALDTGEASFNGTVWKSIAHPNLPAVTFTNYQIGTEPKQSISRNPGTTASKAVVSAARFKDSTGWHATSFTAADITIDITDGRGNISIVNAPAGMTSAVNDHFHFNWLGPQSFEHWDDR